MRHIQFVAVGIISLTLLAGAADAQKKPTRKTPSKQPPVAKALLPPLEVRAAREKVDTQLVNVTRFVDVLGPIAQGIETLEESAKTKPLQKATADKNEANKIKVIEAIRNLKTGLANLETEFRTKPVLRKYLPGIEGITDLAAESEDSAIAGKFVASKEPLRNVARKLADALAALPK